MLGQGFHVALMQVTNVPDSLCYMPALKRVHLGFKGHQLLSSSMLKVLWMMRKGKLEEVTFHGVRVYQGILDIVSSDLCKDSLIAVGFSDCMLPQVGVCHSSCITSSLPLSDRDAA